MNEPRFESEYEDSVVPTFKGAPATHAQMRDSADAEDPATQTSVLLGTTVIQAVESFYLAKRFMQYFGDLPENDDRVGQAIESIRGRLMRMAVLDIAALNDAGLTANDPNHSRTSSLPVVHNRMGQHLADVKASSGELSHLRRLREDIDCNRYAPLEYVRHLRNKWAGHPSLDRRFDDWASADKSLSVATTEAALVRLANNAQDTANFIASTPALQDFHQASASEGPHGSGRPKIDLSSIVSLALRARWSAGEQVRALRAQITGNTMLERFACTGAYQGERY